jgi:hypothetical protein
MSHLPGFWQPELWNNVHWIEYQSRLKKKGYWAEWLDQFLHRLMGKVMSRKRWEKREAKQWPSGTGAYDACRDHYHWLMGAGYHHEATMLSIEASKIRPGFRLG